MTSMLPSGDTYWFDFQGQKIGLELTMLDPVRAQDLLDNYNNRNRPISIASVLKYARDISDGVFFFTGEPLIIGEDGNLQDGQNRAKAVVESKKSIPVLIVYNISIEAMAAIDQGKNRTVRDILTTAPDPLDMPNESVVASIARQLMMGDKKLTRYTDNRQRIAKYVQQHHEVLADTAAWARLIHHDSPGLDTRHITNKERKSVAPSAVGTLSLVMEKLGGDRQDIRLFFEKVVGRVRADSDVEHRSMKAIEYFLTNNTPLTYGGTHKITVMMSLFELLITAYNRVQKRVPIQRLTPARNDNPPRWFDDLPKVVGHHTREDVI
jgi:hypothetical protein